MPRLNVFTRFAAFFLVAAFSRSLSADETAPLFGLADRAALVRGQSSPYDEPLATDRPDFTEASSTVGHRVLQIESGYTYSYNDHEDVLTQAHSGPEALFRYGLSDLLELRVFWNYVWERERASGVVDAFDGAQDLGLGFKIALTEQCHCRPEAAVILATTAPTGGKRLSSDHAEFAVNFLYSWEVANGWSLGASTGYSTSSENAVAAGPLPDIVFDRHNVFNQSVALGIPLTEAWGMYWEYFGLFSEGLENNVAEHYVNGGVTYLIDNDHQLDFRVGKGLNPDADDLFAGAGLSVRF